MSETLVWALPAPYGPLGAGALTLLDSIFMAPATSTAVTQDDLEKSLARAVGDMEAYVTELLAKRDQDDIAAFLGWFTRERDVLDMIGDDAPYIEKEVLPVLDRMVAPGSGSLINVVKHMDRAHSERHFDDDDAFGDTILSLVTLVQSMAVILFALRMRVMLMAKVTAISEEAGDVAKLECANGIWLGYYAELVAAIRGTPRSLGYPQQARTRLAQLVEAGAAYRNRVEARAYRSGVIVAPPTFGQSAGLDLSERTIVHSYAECQSFYEQLGFGAFAPMYCPGGPMVGTVWSKDDLEAIIRKWEAAGNEWYDHRPPLPPKEAPRLVVDGPWGAPTPQQGGNWFSGNAVAYAIAYKNDKGRSPLGPFCGWIEVSGSAFPTIEVPPDPLDMATSILVYRKFRSGGTEVQLLKILTSGERQFQDRRP